MLADAGLRPSGREGRLRALPGVLGPVGVGARAARARTATGSMISSSAPAASAACRLAAARPSSTAHFAVRRRGVRRAAGAVRGRRPRRARRARRRRCTSSRVVDGEVVGDGAAVPAAATGCGRATGWRCCPDARVHRLGGELVQLRGRGPRARCGGRGWSRRCRCPTCASSSASAGRATATPAPYHGVMHQPMAIPPLGR